MGSQPLKQTSVALRRRRRQLLRHLPPSIVFCEAPSSQRYKPCGKPGCKCARGPGHGPKYYLSVSHYGRQPQMDYIPQDYQSQARECLANYHRLRQILDEVCAINHQLLRRREVL
jgi:hypothetical protein